MQIKTENVLKNAHSFLIAIRCLGVFLLSTRVLTCPVHSTISVFYLSRVLLIIFPGRSYLIKRTRLPLTLGDILKLLCAFQISCETFRTIKSLYASN